MGKLEPKPIETVVVPAPAPTLESLANSRAEQDPLPGPALNAFTKGQIKAAGHFVRKFVAYDHVILKQLDSPLRRMMLELAKPPELQEKMENSDQENWDLCLQFTIPVNEAEELIEQGVDVFKKAAKERVGKAWDESEVSFVILAVFQQLKNSVEAANKYAAEAKDAKEISFFQEATG
jgi:hypothetical protein